MALADVDLAGPVFCWAIAVHGRHVIFLREKLSHGTCLPVQQLVQRLEQRFFLEFLFLDALAGSIGNNLFDNHGFSHELFFGL